MRLSVRTVVSKCGVQYLRWSVGSVASTSCGQLSAVFSNCGGQYVWCSVRAVYSKCGGQYVRWSVIVVFSA